MNTCETCGQRVGLNDSKSVTRYYIPWCENEILHLQSLLLSPEHGNEYVLACHYKEKLAIAIEALEKITKVKYLTLDSNLKNDVFPYGQMVEDTTAKEALDKLKELK
jgi:hypothetical protein